MTPDQLTAALDAMQQAAGGDPALMPGLIAVKSSVWCDSLYAIDPRARLCWIGAAAVEAVLDGQLLPRKARKQLFSRIDRALKQLLATELYEAPRNRQKELLYLVALADSQGPRP